MKKQKGFVLILHHCHDNHHRYNYLDFPVQSEVENGQDGKRNKSHPKEVRDQDVVAGVCD